MIDPDDLSKLCDNHLYKRYYEASKQPNFMQNESGGTGWAWRDSYVDQDFAKLKGIEESITDTLVCLKSFYMMYFGAIGTTVNLGALLEQILVRSPSFTSQTEKLVIFNSTGSIPPTPYVPSVLLNAKFEEFMKEAITSENTSFPVNVYIPPPAEPPHARLVGSTDPTPEFAVPTEAPAQSDYKTVSEQDFIDFKRGVQSAFKVVISASSTTPGTSQDREADKDAATPPKIEYSTAADALQSLHLTATYLTLVMLRRITKRDTDLIAAFGRQNIHRNYTDMVPSPLGIAVPPPAYRFNTAMRGAVSVSTEAGRHIGTIMLSLMKTCTASATDKPDYFLEQERIGMEAILKATCMTHIAGTGIPLATLFVTVRGLYNKSDWETIKWLSYKELQHSISKIINFRSDHYKVISKGNDSVKLFLYCRLVHQNYHPDLSYRGNEELCYLMACLIDLKSVPTAGTGGAKGAMWTQNLNSDLKRDIESVAKIMYSES